MFPLSFSLLALCTDRKTLADVFAIRGEEVSLNTLTEEVLDQGVRNTSYELIEQAIDRTGETVSSYSAQNDQDDKQVALW